MAEIRTEGLTHVYSAGTPFEQTAIENVNLVDDDDAPKTYYDLHGRRLDTPHGLCIERSANGKSRKVIM